VHKGSHKGCPYVLHSSRLPHYFLREPALPTLPVPAMFRP